ncbi:hypothetical protein [Brevundimonas variabilis]|uniref:Uncharacterized protein n=1 Tax=Brevundimonas variabilis TaxID=74312 RepID=A0A7W9FD75_9CAUL|nr:hypothetical protein [Brevundimonas variabilis]MBB5744957.1 hypothetical protein [Brevundimonas variabilis]
MTSLSTHPGESRDPAPWALFKVGARIAADPAQADSHKDWVPAFAGMSGY